MLLANDRNIGTTDKHVVFIPFKDYPIVYSFEFLVFTKYFMWLSGWGDRLKLSRAGEIAKADNGGEGREGCTGLPGPAAQAKSHDQYCRGKDFLMEDT